MKIVAGSRLNKEKKKEFRSNDSRSLALNWKAWRISFSIIFH
jgi:hypothetical protein